MTMNRPKRVVLAEVDDRADVVVRQRRGEPGLAIEQLADPRVDRERRLDELERERLAERLVADAQHAAHAAPAELAVDDVAAADEVAGAGAARAGSSTPGSGASSRRRRRRPGTRSRRAAFELARDERLRREHRARDRRQQRLVSLTLHRFPDVEIAVRRSRHHLIVLSWSTHGRGRAST